MSKVQTVMKIAKNSYRTKIKNMKFFLFAELRNSKTWETNLNSIFYIFGTAYYACLATWCNVFDRHLIYKMWLGRYVLYNATIRVFQNTAIKNFPTNTWPRYALNIPNVNVIQWLPVFKTYVVFGCTPILKISVSIMWNKTCTPYA